MLDDIGRSAGMLTLALLIPIVAASTDTSATPALWKTMGNQEKAALGGQFFAGCQVSTVAGPPGTVNLFYTILRGSCLGHSFSTEGTQYSNACLIGPTTLGSLGTLWNVHHCTVDGRLTETLNFDANHQPVDEATIKDVLTRASNADYLQRMSLLAAEAKPFFAGCTILPASVDPDINPPTVQGRCLGHSFSHALPDDSNAAWACQFGRSGGLPAGPAFWSVRRCNYDGKPVNNVTFTAATGKQLSIVSEYTTVAQSRATDQAADKAKHGKDEAAMQSRLLPEKELLPRVCSDATPAHASGQHGPASIYGLLLGEPPPCLDVCSREAAGSKKSMCFTAAGASPTQWGTERFSVHLNEDALDAGSTLATGDPTLEFLDGKLVGVRFKDISPSSEQAIVDAMSSKFGNGEYQSGANAYTWTTSSAKVRYSVRDHLGVDGILSALLAADAGDGLGTLTIYTPGARALVDRYEAEQAKVNKKPGL